MSKTSDFISNSNFRSDAVISLDKWHAVMIDKTRKIGTLLIDNNPRFNYTGESKVD